VLETVRVLASRHTGQSIALVTHAGVISQVFGALHHTSAARWELWRPRNGSLSEVWLRDTQTRAISFDRRPSGAPEQVGAA
jgi:broad specificity phosphatase PhoE